jgi:hypothetical protein
LPIVAKINQHFKLNKDDYFDLDDDQLLGLIEEFEEHNKKVRSELKNSQNKSRRR